MEPKDLAAIGGEIKEFTEVASRRMAEADARLLSIEQRITAPCGGLESSGDPNDVARTITESAQYKSFVENNGRSTGRIPVGSFYTKSTIVNASGQNQPLVPSDRRPGILAPGQQQLTVRDLMPKLKAAGGQGIVEYPLNKIVV